MFDTFNYSFHCLIKYLGKKEVGILFNKAFNFRGIHKNG